MNGPLEWIGAIGSVVAAAIIASDLGRRWTGWAFVLFSVMSVTWISAALMAGTMPIIVQNAVMLAVNLWGVWQYLLNPRKKRQIELTEACAEKAGRRIEAEEAAASSA